MITVKQTPSWAVGGCWCQGWHHVGVGAIRWLDLAGLHYLMTLGSEGTPSAHIQLNSPHWTHGNNARVFLPVYQSLVNIELGTPDRGWSCKVLWEDAKLIFTSIRIRLWLWIKESLYILRGRSGQTGFLLNRRSPKVPNTLYSSHTKAYLVSVSYL